MRFTYPIRTEISREILDQLRKNEGPVYLGFNYNDDFSPLRENQLVEAIQLDRNLQIMEITFSIQDFERLSRFLLKLKDTAPHLFVRLDFKSWTKINAQSFSALCKAIDGNPVIESLDLSNLYPEYKDPLSSLNEYHSMLEELALALRENDTLRNLFLPAIERDKRKYIINYHQYDQNKKKWVCHDINFTSIRPIASFIENCRVLRVLDARGFILNIENEPEILIKSLNLNKTLRALSLNLMFKKQNQTQIARTTLREITESLEDNPSLNYLGLLVYSLDVGLLEHSQNHMTDPLQPFPLPSHFDSLAKNSKSLLSLSYYEVKNNVEANFKTKKNDTDTNGRDTSAYSLARDFFWAIVANDLDKVRELRKKGASVNCLYLGQTLWMELGIPFACTMTSSYPRNKFGLLSAYENIRLEKISELESSLNGIASYKFSEITKKIPYFHHLSHNFLVPTHSRGSIEEKSHYYLPRTPMESGGSHTPLSLALHLSLFYSYTHDSNKEYDSYRGLEIAKFLINEGADIDEILVCPSDLNSSPIDGERYGSIISDHGQGKTENYCTAFTPILKFLRRDIEYPNYTKNIKDEKLKQAFQSFHDFLLAKQKEKKEQLQQKLMRRKQLIASQSDPVPNANPGQPTARSSSPPKSSASSSSSQSSGNNPPPYTSSASSSSSSSSSSSTSSSSSSSSNSQQSQQKFEEAGRIYCEAKAAFYTQDIKSSIALFLQARTKYKELIKSNELSGNAKQKAEKRLAKLKDPDGKYCPQKLSSGYKP